MGKGLSFRLRGLCSVGHRSHARAVSRGGAGSEGVLASLWSGSCVAVIGGCALGGFPYTHTPLGHEAILQGVASLDFPTVFAKQGPFQKLLLNLCCKLERRRGRSLSITEASGHPLDGPQRPRGLPLKPLASCDMQNELRTCSAGELG